MLLFRDISTSPLDFPLSEVMIIPLKSTVHETPVAGQIIVSANTAVSCELEYVNKLKTVTNKAE